jgi:hypothetical protein
LKTSSEIQAIHDQAGKILASGILGRSRFYTALLEFLVRCAEQGRVPKELEIAAEVFDRGSEFDPSQDSMVRVYAHNLRQKLQQFYAEAGRDEVAHLTIPKGEYRLGIAEAAELAGAVPPADAGSGRKFKIAAAAVALVAVGVALGLAIPSRPAPVTPPTKYALAAASPLWRPLFDDDLPVLVVVGDYFIFGEVDGSGNVERLVREFSINSSKDLDDLMLYQPELMSRYIDLDLTYLPRSAAFALRDILGVVYSSAKPVRVISMSELNAADFKASHVIYIGYVSALDKLLDFVFASSQLTVGVTFDELVDDSTGTVYASEAGMPSGLRNYRDYGLLSTFPGPNGNQFLIVAGTRDAGLMQTAQVLGEPMHLRMAERAAAAEGFDSTHAVELLFEVTGFDRTNLDATIVHAAALDYRTIWGGELLQAN